MWTTMPHTTRDLRLTADEAWAATLAFEARINPTPTSTGCILWTGYTGKSGYGRMHVGKRQYLAHRVAWVLVHGRIPPGKFICHACDNPTCVNVTHLWVGDACANNNDALRKGRKIRGGPYVGVRRLPSGRYAGRLVTNRGMDTIHCGVFDTPEEAARAVRVKRLEVLGLNL